MHSIHYRYMANSDNTFYYSCMPDEIKYMVHICSAQCARQAICAHIHINFYNFFLSRFCSSSYWFCLPLVFSLAWLEEKRNIIVCALFLASFSFFRWVHCSPWMICVLFQPSNSFGAVLISAVRSFYICDICLVDWHTHFSLSLFFCSVFLFTK